MSKKKIHRIFVEGLICTVLLFVLIFFVGFRVTKVEIKGNEFYSDKEIKNMILDVPIAKNTILAMMIKTEEKTKDAQLIEKVSVERKNRNTLLIQVKEKKMIGYFEYEGKYAHFDRQGIIQIFTDEPMKNVPYIEGLDVKEVKQGEKLKGINTRKLNSILSVGKMLEKTEQKPDKLIFNNMKQLVLYYGEIEVRLGNDENMDEKMNRLSGIIPQLEGMTGILHLENITKDTKEVVFDNIQKSDENDLDEENLDEENLDEENLDEENLDEENLDEEDLDEEDLDEEDLDEDTSDEDISEDDALKEDRKDSKLDYTDGSDSADTRLKKGE